MANPLRNANKMKLAIFSSNGNGVSLTNHPDRFKASWENNVNIAKMCDQYDIEAIVAFSRYKPYGPDGHYSGRTFDCMTWAAGLAAVTEKVCVMATVHPMLNNPVMAAKAAATIDHISNGRLGLNIVAGWHEKEFEMFDVTLGEHDDRYDYADEWIHIFERTLVEDTGFDFKGRYLKTKGAFTDPKAIQRRPIIMNAGGSERGRHFTGKNSDVAFIQPHGTDLEIIRKQVEIFRSTARETYDRDIQIWMHAYVVQRDSMAEAEAHVHDIADLHGDTDCADFFISMNIANAQSVPPGAYAHLRRGLMAGAGGYPLLGTADDITATLEALSGVGVDGLLLGFFRYEQEIPVFGETVLPMLARGGLRVASA